MTRKTNALEWHSRTTTWYETERPCLDLLSNEYSRLWHHWKWKFRRKKCSAAFTVFGLEGSLSACVVFFNFVLRLAWGRTACPILESCWYCWNWEAPFQTPFSYESTEMRLRRHPIKESFMARALIAQEYLYLESVFPLVRICPYKYEFF